VLIGVVAQFTIMPTVAWVLCKVIHLPTDLALGVILVGCCPGGTASNVITYIAGGDVALSAGDDYCLHINSAYYDSTSCICSGRSLGGGIFLGNDIVGGKSNSDPGASGNFCFVHFAGKHVDKVSDAMPLISVIAIVMIIGGIVAVNAEKILSMWSSCSRCCGDSQFLRHDTGTFSCEAFST